MNNTLTQKAYQHIHDKLCDGQLQPGSRLSNRGVAKEVGISFTPVREALSRLVSEGLLEYRQGVGVFVPTLGIQEICESYELREILESEAAAKIAKNPPAVMLAEMTESYERMEAILTKVSNTESGANFADWASVWQMADSAFHVSLLRASGNRRLLDTVEGLRTSMKMMMGPSLRRLAGDHQESMGIVGHRFASESQDHIERTLDEHGRILDALQQGDAATAKMVMVEHIRSGLKLALDAYNCNHMGNTPPFLRGPHIQQAGETHNICE